MSRRILYHVITSILAVSFLVGVSVSWLFLRLVLSPPAFIEGGGPLWTFVPHAAMALCYTFIVGITAGLRIQPVRDSIEDAVGREVPLKRVSHVSWLAAILTILLVLLSPVFLTPIG